MAIHTLQIKSRKWTRVITNTFLVVEATITTKIAHLVDAVSTTAVWFRANNATVPVLTHPQCVGERNPINRIDIHGHMPVMKFLRMSAPQLNKIAKHHQPVNVM